MGRFDPEGVRQHPGNDRHGTDDAGRETGECEYLPGEDGGYWNYILKADYNKEGTGALDLTKYYGLLPHGKSAYVYDAEAGTVVFTSGIVSITAEAPAEGDYSYGSSTLSVPGIAFRLQLCPGRRRRGPIPGPITTGSPSDRATT